MTICIPSEPESRYARAIRFAKKYYSPERVDRGEVNLTIIASSVIATLNSTCLLLYYGEELKTPEANPLIYTAKVSKIAFIALINWLAIGVIGFFGLWRAHTFNTKRPFIERQMVKIAQDSKNSPKSLLILHSQEDFFGALSTHAEVSRLEKLAKTHSIEFIPVSLKAQIKTENGRRYDVVLIKGHGSSTETALASDLKVSMDDKESYEWVNQLVKEGGKIILFSCSTAKGEENIARKISAACPKATLYAASEKVNSIDGIAYDEEGTPQFKWEGKDITKIYLGGNQIN
jgi:hypothetical protein